MPAAIDAMMGEGLREFQPMDYDVSFENPASRKAISGMRAQLEDMEGLEGKIDMPFKISSGTRDISLPLLGVERDTAFYRFRDKEGNPLPFPRDGILLSDYAARKLDVGVGDSVKLHSYLYDRDDRWAVVSGIVYRALGTRAYADMDYLARNFLEPGAVTGCFLDSADPDAARKLMELPAVASVVSVRDARAVLKTYTRMINAFLAFLVALSGLLGGIVIYSVAIINIGERETEFSTLMVQGMSHWEIFSLLLRENNVVTILGFIVGVPLTALFLEYSGDLFSTEQYTIMMSASAVNYLDGALLTGLFIVTAQAAAWRRIKNLDFLSALKNRE
jgi:putative ABC transport system permease protein